MRHPSVQPDKAAWAARRQGNARIGAADDGLDGEAQVQQALQVLTPREAQVLRLRFGLGEQRPRATPIQDELGVGQLWLRHLQARALRKLRVSALSS